MARTRKVTGGLFVGAVVAGAVAIAVLVNVLSGAVFGRLDLTENRINTLSDASIEAVRALDDLEVVVYISPDLPETIRDEMGGFRVMRDTAQAFKDKIEEYQSHASGTMRVRYETEDVVERAKTAKLRAFSGEEATAKGGRLEFKQYVLGATFNHMDAQEVLPLALYPEHYEFEMTRLLLRLKEKVEHGVLMKDVLAAGAKVHDAVKACDDAFSKAEPEDTGATSPFALLSGEKSKAKLEAYKAAATTLETSCGDVAKAVEGAKPLQGRLDLLDSVLELGGLFQESFGAFRQALAGGAEKEGEALGVARQLRAIAAEVESEHQSLVDSPGRKSIGFVCAGRAFCPFPSTKPLVPPELDGVIGQKNPFATQVVGGMKQMEERINNILSNVERNLFKRRGFHIVKVDLAEDIPDDVTALVLLGPTSALSEWELYAVDQFVLGGGSLVVFLNAWDVSLLNLSDKGEMNVTKMVKNTSNVGDLLATWGVSPKGSLVAEPASHDTLTVLSLIRQGQLTWQTQRSFAYPLLPIFTDFDGSSPLVRAVSSMTLPWVTSLEVKSVPGVEVTPLVRSTDAAITVSDPSFALEPAAQLAAVAQLRGEGPQVVVATAQGELPSHFAGKPAPEKPKAPPKPPEEGGEVEDPDKPEVKTSKDERREKGKGRVLVVGSNLGLGDLSRDTIFEGFDLTALTGQDFTIVDKFRGWGAKLQNWEVRLGQIQHTLGDNIQFLFNVLDWAIQKEALVEIRSKQYQRRPLEQVDEGGQSLVRVAAVAGAPLLFVLLGVLRAWMRRNRRRRLKV